MTPTGLLTLIALAAWTATAHAQPTPVALTNPSFDEGLTDAGLPLGWSRYAGGGLDQRLSIVEDGEQRWLLIEDGDRAAELGVYQDVPVEGGETYRASVMVRGVTAASAAGAHLQLRLFPSNDFAQAPLLPGAGGQAAETSVTLTAPEGTRTARIYLYTHLQPTPKVMVTDVQLIAGVEPPPPPPPAPPPIPEPIPPQYDRLKDLHLSTPLVAEGQPAATIVAPASGVHDAPAQALQAAIREVTGVTLPVVTDEDEAAAVPLHGHVIALGNRNTNRLISDLYDGFHVILDLKYPGPGGHVVRTAHNPCGNGFNVIFAGGSDVEGVAAAAGALVETLREAGGGQGELAVGRLAEITLGQGLEPPESIREVGIWQASVGYGNSGYFGWNSISKRMALYYMTGDEFHAREVVRLSFPDEQALAEIDEIDQEMIENKNDPLAGPYHYNAHFMILFWELIEESPVFTDQERLDITNAFARQLNHRVPEGIYRRTSPPAFVGGRHADWSAVSLYVLGRYLNKHYPHPVWQHCVDASDMYFSALDNSAWMAGNNDHLFWYNTFFEPLTDYTVLSGRRELLDSGNLQQALKTQDILFTGRIPDPYLRTASLAWLLKTAYLTGDARWLFYLERTQLDTDAFRLGQSFWPDEGVTPRPPEELVGTWTIQPMPEPMWAARDSGIPLEQSYLWGSFRTSLDGGGDFILLDGFNGGGRNPYHTLAHLEHRLGGVVALRDYGNQVLTSADGMVEPIVAMDAALLHADVVGETAVAVMEVPRTPYANWRRTVAQRIGEYGLFVDELEFRADSENMTVETTWQPVRATWNQRAGVLRIAGEGEPGPPPGWLSFRALDAQYESSPPGPNGTSRLASIDIVLLKATGPGDWIEMSFTLDEPVTGDVFVDLLNHTDRGRVRLHLNDAPVVDEYRHHADRTGRERVPLGRHELAAGEHRLRVEVVAQEEGVERCFVGLIGVSIQPEGVQPAPERGHLELHPSQIMPSSGAGILSMEWQGAVREGERRVMFYLLGRGGQEPLACAQLAPTAAALALPAPALAVVGEHEGIAGDLVILAADHLHGRALTVAGLEGPLIRADAPVDVDWDFDTGVAQVVTGTETTLRLALARPDEARLNGEAVRLSDGGDGLHALTFPAGRHVLTGAVPADRAGDNLAGRLGAMVTAAVDERAAAATVAPAPRPPAEPLPEVAAQSLGVAVVGMATMPSDRGPLLCVAAGKAVRVMAPDGEEVMTLETEGDIRVIRWWEEHGLLLVGCADEKVVAFDASGERRWEFISEMHPEVYAQGKQYWFKSAHPGIHGLHTGVFMDGESQAFVGSACTLEILDETGALVERLPVFWGPGWRFALMDAPDGSRDLLIARWPNDSDAPAVVNSETLAVGRRFHGVPGGHTFVGGWTAQNRVAMFHEDLDGDGVRHVVGATNGVWNRVTVWREDGTPVRNAQFGPGPKAPGGMLPDMMLCDLNGDGTQEVVVASLQGLVVVLNHRLERVWARRVGAGPRLLRCVTPPGAQHPWIIAALDDGTVLALDHEGRIVREARADGRPTALEAIEAEGGPLVAVGTSAGDVRLLGVR